MIWRAHLRGMAVVAAAAAKAWAGAAGAEEQPELCFDKGALTYHPCPQAEPAPEPVVEVVEETPFYLAARAGVAFVGDVGFDYAQPLEEFGAAPGAADVSYDPGYIVTGAFGYTFDDVGLGFALRPEIEIGYLAADVDSANGASLVGAVSGSDGEVSALFGFVNLWADLPVSESLDVILGGGVGAAGVDFDGVSLVGPGGAALLDDGDTALAINLSAGLAYALTDDVQIEALYRYLRFFAVDVTSSGPTPVDDSVDVDAHVGMLGLRLSF